MRKRQEIYFIRKPKQIRALGSPLRQSIVDVLAYRGPQDAGALSQTLDRPVDSLNYHLKILKKVGLIVPVGTSSTKGRNGTVYSTPSSRMAIEHDPHSRTYRDNAKRSAMATLRLTAKDCLKSVNHSDLNVHGPGRTFWVGRVEGTLTAQEMRKVNRAIKTLCETLCNARATSGKRVALTWALLPSVPGQRAPSRRRPTPAERKGSRSSGPRR